MKILNLYAGIGGNRKLWGDSHEITAVEIDKDIASIYQTHFPQDKVIVGDAHQYLLDHYKEFDFIWSSPPCPTHSKARFGLGVIFIRLPANAFLISRSDKIMRRVYERIPPRTRGIGKIYTRSIAFKPIVHSSSSIASAFW